MRLNWIILTLVVVVAPLYTRVAAQIPASVLVLDVQVHASTVYLTPVVIYEKGSFVAPYSAIKGEVARRRFVEKYFKQNSPYILVFGGGNAGTLRIKESYWNDGAYAYADLTEEEPGRIHGQIHALATNWDTTARGGPFRHAPSADERNAAISLAKAAYLEHKVAPALIDQMEVVNLTAIDVDGDNKPELVGTFKVPQKDKEAPPHHLFLIAEGEGQNFKAARVNYQFNPGQTEYSLGQEMLSDNMDIDGDGVNEVVSVFTGPAYKDFCIVYQRKNGKWNQVFSGAGLR